MRARVIAVLAAAATAAAVATASPAGALGSSGSVPDDGYVVVGDTGTFPLRPGRTTGGDRFWYVVIEASDSQAADLFGVRVAQKLENAAGSAAVQRGTVDHGILVTPGRVDFRPERRVAGTPGTGFPPITAEPGSVGHDGYSPLVQLPDGSVINAPVVANATGRHDKVLGIDRAAGRVRLALTHGFARTEAVRYLSTDASAPDVAALEGATWAAPLGRAPGRGDDSTHSSRASLAAFVNGPLAPANERQGLNSALLGGGDPLNVLAWLPGQGRYSPLWDVHLTAWAAGVSPRRVTEFAAVEDLAEAGRVTGPAGAAWGANGIVVNCPILALG
jgi:hypothetical protein